MKPKTKNFLLNFFGGLVSNDRAMEGAKTNKWWVALIIGLFSILIPVIPITVTQANTYGASFLSSYVYRYDYNIATIAKEMGETNKDFKVDANKELHYYENDTVVARGTDVDEKPIAYHINENTHQYELLVYYTERNVSEVSDYIKAIDAVKYIKGSYTPASEEGDNTYGTSILVLYKQGMYTKLYKDDSAEAGSNTYTNYGTDWKYFADGHALMKDSLPEGKTADQVNLNNTEDVKAIFNNWKDYYNRAYTSQKIYSTWMTSLLFFGIYAALTMVMGFLVWLLTRGKNNMFNYMTWIECQKIVWWAALSPAILAMILGFIFSNFAQMMFIILIGLRVMWISMKQLRPQY